MTPAQIFALVERKNIIDKRTDSRFGMIVCTILNLFIKSGSKAVGPLQAMGYDKEEDAAPSGGTGDGPKSKEEAILYHRVMQAKLNRLAIAQKGRE